jgi:hypothetical protein
MPAFIDAERERAGGEGPREVEQSAVVDEVGAICRLGVFEPGGEIPEHPLPVPHVKGLIPSDAVVVKCQRHQKAGGHQENERTAVARNPESQGEEYSPESESLPFNAPPEVGAIVYSRREFAGVVSLEFDFGIGAI